MTKEKVFKISSLLLLIYLAGVIFLCLANFSSVKIHHSNFFIKPDKIVHFLMFIPFPFLMWLHIKTSTYSKKIKSKSYAIILILGILLGSFTELAQKYITKHRTADIYDLLADIIGILAGTLIIYLLGTLIAQWVKKAIKYESN